MNDSRDMGYVFGKGRDSVVSKSIRISKERELQSAQLLNRKITLAQKSKEFGKPTSKIEEPLLFPFPITRKVDAENLF